MQTAASAPHGPRILKQATLRKPPARSVKTQMRILLVVVFGAYLVHAAEAETLKLRYGQAYSSAHSIFSLPVAVADREGLFAREGLKVDIIVPIPGGSDKMIAALHDEWVDLTHVATPFLIRAALAGSDAVAIAAEFKNPVYSLIANSSIDSFAELKGKVLGLADEAGSISISMRKLLAIHGVDAGEFGVKGDRGNAGAFCLPASWRVRCGRPRAAAGLAGDRARLSIARPFERSGTRPPVYSHRGSAILGGDA